ncbi:phosphotyrosine protein phosphatase I superfamily [Globomyces pollinis-pini]|nr:phosphotyrosine protein phosphatase I superfamily [Globomyces pollinis-pini]
MLVGKYPSILFVCRGNTCRSPMAEAILNNLNNSNFSLIASAGTQAIRENQPPNPKAIEICKKFNIPISHCARQITTKDFNTFDYILCMDQSNLEQLHDLMPKSFNAHVALLGEFLNVKDLNEQIIPDPFGGTLEDYENTFKKLLLFDTLLLDQISHSREL